MKKVLIANRGEIAVRIIRACRELRLPTVAVYSLADKDAMHVRLADQRICIGAAPSKDSYLNIPAVLSACKLTGADAVHPGFGFLAENSDFARGCADQGIKFIGPSPESMDLLGNKARAKATMREAGVPVIPGSTGTVPDVLLAKQIAQRIGYPIMVKASAGGGGRGIRVAHTEEELEFAFKTARQEAIACFGDGEIYMEKFLINPRHIEVQILADEHGNVIHLGERDCSVQRRNQKMIEESPSPAPMMDAQLRERMGEAAKKAVKAADYCNAGTIEFLVDANGDFYFMEMNTRVQVEHPVTEMVTGLDIVKQQIAIAQGNPLPVTQEQVQMKGHSIECRINAEDPKNDFCPSPGVVKTTYMPGGMGVRVDSAVYAGYKIPPYYDSMIAKVIVHGATREEAILKMRSALADFYVDGISTNLEYQRALLQNEDFTAGNYNIGFLERVMKEGRL